MDTRNTFLCFKDTLWRFLADAGHEDGTLDANMTIKAVMDTWTLQMGYPVISVARSYETNIISFSQDRFLINPNSTAEETYTWYVPISYGIPNTLEGLENTSVKLWIFPDNTNVSIREDAALPNLPLVVNVQETGFYRVNYDAQNWKLISDFLTSDHTAIHRMNRAQILDDVFSLARAGLLDYTLALEQTKYLSKELDYIPWASAFSGFQYLQSMLKRSPGFGKFKHYMILALQPLYARLGFMEKPDDTILDGKLRQNFFFFFNFFSGINEIFFYLELMLLTGCARLARKIVHNEALTYSKNGCFQRILIQEIRCHPFPGKSPSTVSKG